MLYQVYVRSFQDSDGDGYGDLRGVVSRLDHLSSLGVDGVWLSPTMPSPDEDWGYDVADYLGVHPELGTLEDLDELVRAAGERQLKVLLDLVPNHTSAAHPWFVEARSGRRSRRRDWYVWADPAPGGGPPNNWRAATGETAWTFDEASGQYYLHNFLASQPDLNWWNPEVHAAFERVLSFWFDRGVAGFRIDVAHGLYKDAELRDNPPEPPGQAVGGHGGQQQLYSANRPESHAVFRSWRRIAERYHPPRLLLGETWVPTIEQLASFYGEGDELQLAFNFPFVFAEFGAAGLAAVVESTLGRLGAADCPVFTASNHDVSRFPTRWAAGDEGMARLGLAVLLSLPGTAVLYYGDEIAMVDVEVPPELERDPMHSGGRGGRSSRDRARTPMCWDDSPTGGFTSPGSTPWLPLGGRGRNVAEQAGRAGSTLELCKALIGLRRRYVGAAARYERLELAGDRWSYRSGSLVVHANFGAEPVAVPLGGAGLQCATGPATHPDPAGDGLVVGPGEAALLA